MGRTNPTYRDALRALEERWADFRRALRRRDQPRFDRRGLFRFLATEREGTAKGSRGIYRGKSPIPRGKIRRIQRFKPDQIHDLRTAAQSDTFLPYLRDRNETLITVLYDTGLRVGELVDVDVCLVDEFEAITESGSAADLLHGLVTLTVDRQAIGVYVTYLADDLRPLPDTARIDGTFARGLNVDLSVEERAELESFISRGVRSAQAILRARLLLNVDKGATDAKINDWLDCSEMRVCRARKRYTEAGISARKHR